MAAITFEGVRSSALGKPGSRRVHSRLVGWPLRMFNNTEQA